jgi:hypothetical protein
MSHPVSFRTQVFFPCLSVRLRGGLDSGVYLNPLPRLAVRMNSDDGLENRL